MSHGEVDALLERLIAQFTSPYDFLRELVQNALDAGSDRVEVILEASPTAGADDTLVYLLTVADTGAGMDEAIIDGELTRLFATTKGDDRTMAGGFGIGFVSVFAWEPEAILLQTGRAGESWEVLFYGLHGSSGGDGVGDGGRGDRRFEKRRLDQPVEGTTITLIRRGPASEAAQIAEAIRDSLWRWCRYCRLEITFEDLTGDAPLELIQDAPDFAGELHHHEAAGDHTIHVAFAVPPRARLLRRGLILAEGAVTELMPTLAATLGDACDHLQLWVDSPGLRTTLARDKVVEDSGRRELETKVVAAVAALRERLVAALIACVSGPWGEAAQRRYSFLHGHLTLERAHLGRRLAELAILRERTGERPISAAALGRALAGRPLLYGGRGLETGLGDAAGTSDAADAAAREGAALALARAVGYPVIDGGEEDRRWLAAFAAELGVGLVALRDALGEVREATVPPPCEALRAACEAALRGLGGRFSGIHLALGDFSQGQVIPALVAGEFARVENTIVVLHSAEALASGPPPPTLWIAEDEPLLRAALRAAEHTPTAAILSVAAAIAALVDPGGVDSEALAEGARRVGEALRPAP